MGAGVTELRYVGYAVADFDAERAFFADPWGLTEVVADDGIAWFAAEGSPQPFVVRLRRANHTGLDALGLSVESAAAVEALHARLAADPDVKLLGPPARLSGPGGGYGFNLFDCDGRRLEIAAEVELRAARQLSRGESIPRELAHVVLHAPDRLRTEAFYVEKLGFKISDWIGDFMSFLRCNEVHHRIALLPGPPALNHVAFEMRSLDEMMRGLTRLRAAGSPMHWGPGRHTAGNNAFSYFGSPNGHVVEYTAEVERVDDAAWTPTRYTPSREIMDQWGTAEGGPERMPHPRADPGLWQPPAA